MPRKARSPEVVEQMKEKIINEAMTLIIEEGFHKMSLRKLANRVGMSATNIYYYYSNKDEIYLNIQIKGFAALENALDEVYNSIGPPLEILDQMIRTYLKFGFSNPDYYQIMLNSDTPRYLEYQSNDLEPVAFRAKQAALNAIAVPLKAIAVVSKTGKSIPEEDILFRAYQMWITLHGVVTLNNRKILLELETPTEELIDRMCRELMAPYNETL